MSGAGYDAGAVSEGGADPGIADSESFTALMTAAGLGHLEVRAC